MWLISQPDAGGSWKRSTTPFALEGSPVVFVECKAHDRPLEDHAGQLARYFNSTPTVHVAVLTNGVKLSLFSDLQQTNLMTQRHGSTSICFHLARSSSKRCAVCARETSQPTT